MFANRNGLLAAPQKTLNRGANHDGWLPETGRSCRCFFSDRTVKANETTHLIAVPASLTDGRASNQLKIAKPCWHSFGWPPVGLGGSAPHANRSLFPTIA